MARPVSLAAGTTEATYMTENKCYFKFLQNGKMIKTEKFVGRVLGVPDRRSDQLLIGLLGMENTGAMINKNLNEVVVRNTILEIG